MEFLSTALTVVITASLTAAFAMQRFKSETRWARKAYAYSQIRKATRIGLEYIEQFATHFDCEPSSPMQEKLERMGKKHTEAIESAKMAISDEFYFMSPEARAAFDHYLEEPRYSLDTDGEDVAQIERMALLDLADTIDQVAQRDLALHSSNAGQIIFRCLQKADGWLEPLANRCHQKPDV